MNEDRSVWSGAVIGAAIEVHKHLGPGLLESAYEACLAHELELRNIPFQHQAALPVMYKGLALEAGYRMDLLVANELVVELKAVDKIEDIHKAQLLTYLKLSGKHTGLLINFNVPYLRDGIVRLVND